MKNLSKFLAVSAVILALTACGKQEETTTGEAAVPPAGSSGQGTGVAGLPASPPSAQDRPAAAGTPSEYGGDAPPAGGSTSPSGAPAPEQKEKDQAK